MLVTLTLNHLRYYQNELCELTLCIKHILTRHEPESVWCCLGLSCKAPLTRMFLKNWHCVTLESHPVYSYFPAWLQWLGSSVLCEAKLCDIVQFYSSSVVLSK